MQKAWLSEVKTLIVKFKRGGLLLTSNCIRKKNTCGFRLENVCGFHILLSKASECVIVHEKKKSRENSI